MSGSRSHIIARHRDVYTLVGMRESQSALYLTSTSVVLHFTRSMFKARAKLFKIYSSSKQSNLNSQALAAESQAGIDFTARCPKKLSRFSTYSKRKLLLPRRSFLSTTTTLVTREVLDIIGSSLCRASFHVTKTHTNLWRMFWTKSVPKCS